MQAMIDRDIHHSCALVVDGSPASRSLLAAQLRDLGVGTVVQTGRTETARQLLEQRRFDIVLCDYHFGDNRLSGQDLFDELSREHLLPQATVFVMVTSEGSPAKVIEAVESALDGYLLKPYTAAALGERLREARRRKAGLRPVFDAIEQGDHAAAAVECERRWARQEAYADYCARIGGELYLRLGRHDDARRVYESVLAALGLPWSRVGVARCQWAAGRSGEARQTLQAVLAGLPELPGHADACDLLGALESEQGELGAAFEAYRRAAQITPGNITRLQRAGTLGFYVGAHAAALPALEVVARLGAQSKMFDAYVLALLGFLHFDAGDRRGLQHAQLQLARWRERHPQALRLRRFDELLRALRHLADGRPPEARLLAARLSAEVERADMDIEAACNAIGLWSRLDDSGFAGDDGRAAVAEIAARYCVSPGSTGLLVAAAHGSAAVTGAVREADAAISALARPQATAEAGQDSLRCAVATLIEHGRRTRNARLIDLAGDAARRHLGAIDDGAALLASVERLAERYGSAAAPLLGSRPGARTDGSLRLRLL